MMSTIPVIGVSEVVDDIRRRRKFGGTLKRRIESKDERAAGGGGEVLSRATPQSKLHVYLREKNWSE